jgi:tetratricopeptide (TPR) repeat protein
MKPSLPVFVFVALVVQLRCAQGAAQASVDDEARSQFDTGVAMFEKGRFEQASIAFARAYELKPSFRLLYNIGQVENELGHFAASLDAYARYLAEGGGSIEKARQDEVGAEIARLEKLVGTVDVRVAEKGATVFVDGRKSGTTPLEKPLVVDLGEHEIQIRRGSSELYREIVKVAGGQNVIVKADAEQGAATAAEDKGAAAAEGAKPEGKPDEAPQRVWTWVALGMGGAAAVGAAITGGLFVSKEKDVKSHCDGSICPTSIEGEADSAKTLGNATTALIAVAGVGLAAGVVLYFLEPKRSEDSKAIEITPAAAPTADGGALAIVGRF